MSLSFHHFLEKTLLLMIVGCFIVSAAQIPGGKFTMGSSAGEPDEKPEHEVTISSFTLDDNLVTEEQYETCVASGKCTPANYNNCLVWSRGKFTPVSVPSAYRNPKFPVVCVSWYQAQAYCRFKGKKLPTEAQWEYASKAGKNTVYSWGNTPPSAANCSFLQKGKPQPVGSYLPNGWGLYDMTGNAWEWVSDFYERDYYSFSEKENPRGPGAGLYRVVRGGGWYSGAGQLKVTNRHWFSPAYPEVSVGFRCAK
ncbi:MAG: formylglycine-generating enzyme family protein [Fibrobacter sp.]|nr:formylglycine-generating enzyme family protein [Fibrobacter sp.]